MPEEFHRIPHDLPRKLARVATRSALEAYRKRYPQVAPGGKWIDDDQVRIWFDIAGKRLEGGIRVTDDAILLDLDFPLVFRPFRKQAIEVIEREVKWWIDRAHAGQLDEADG